MPACSLGPGHHLQPKAPPKPGRLGPGARPPDGRGKADPKGTPKRGQGDPGKLHAPTRGGEEKYGKQITLGEGTWGLYGGSGPGGRKKQKTNPNLRDGETIRTGGRPGSAFHAPLINGQWFGTTAGGTGCLLGWAQPLQAHPNRGGGGGRGARWGRGGRGQPNERGTQRNSCV